MKLSVGFASFSLLIAAAATAAATVEAYYLYDAAAPKRYSVHAHSCDPAHPGKHCRPTHVAHQGGYSIKLAESPPQDSPSNCPAPAPGGSGTINPSDAGKCYPVGATGVYQPRRAALVARQF